MKVTVAFNTTFHFSFVPCLIHIKGITVELKSCGVAPKFSQKQFSY